MNERMQELALQAKLKTELWSNPEPFVIYKEDVYNPGGLEKFAELIVLECFKAAMVESKGRMNPIDLMTRMKQRVGVKNEIQI